MYTLGAWSSNYVLKTSNGTFLKKVSSSEGIDPVIKEARRVAKAGRYTVLIYGPDGEYKHVVDPRENEYGYRED